MLSYIYFRTILAQVNDKCNLMGSSTQHVEKVILFIDRIVSECTIRIKNSSPAGVRLISRASGDILLSIPRRVQVFFKNFI